MECELWKFCFLDFCCAEALILTYQTTTTSCCLGVDRRHMHFNDTTALVASWHTTMAQEKCPLAEKYLKGVARDMRLSRRPQPRQLNVSLPFVYALT